MNAVPIGTGNAPSAQPVDVYSNQRRVELVVNGKSLGSATPDSVKRATWNVVFTPGDNIIEARDHLSASGARVLGDGEPKIGAHDKPVLFLHPKDFCGTLIELEQA